MCNTSVLEFLIENGSLKEVEGRENYEFIKGDILDGRLVDEVVGDGIEVIINFAAESHVD